MADTVKPMTTAEFIDLVRACKELGALRVEAHGYCCILPQGPSQVIPSSKPARKPMTEEERFEAALAAELP